VLGLEMGVLALELEALGRVAAWEPFKDGVVNLTKVPEF